MPRASCLRLLEHLVRAAASRTFCTAGSRRPIKTAMMAITTSSSMSVKADRRVRRFIRVALTKGMNGTGSRLPRLQLDVLVRVAGGDGDVDAVPVALGD